MKTISCWGRLLAAIAVFGVAVSATSVAIAAGQDGGGGDICQDRIQEIRNNISDWIQAGRSADLDFTKSGTSLADYNQKMQTQIVLTRLDDQKSISCTDDPTLVRVDGAQKTCVAYVSPTRPRILCYRGTSKDGQFVSGFMGLSEDDQYFQVHHEFAVLAGIEDQPGRNSDYPLSEQISGRLEVELIKKLPVKSALAPIGATLLPLDSAQPLTMDMAKDIMNTCLQSMTSALYTELMGENPGRSDGFYAPLEEVTHDGQVPLVGIIQGQEPDSGSGDCDAEDRNWPNNCPLEPTGTSPLITLGKDTGLYQVTDGLGINNLYYNDQAGDSDHQVPDEVDFDVHPEKGDKAMLVAHSFLPWIQSVSIDAQKTYDRLGNVTQLQNVMVQPSLVVATGWKQPIHLYNGHVDTGLTWDLRNFVSCVKAHRILRNPMF